LKAIRKIRAAKLATFLVAELITLPPLILLPRHKARYEAKFFTVGKRLISVPTSAKLIIARFGSIPSIYVRSTPFDVILCNKMLRYSVPDRFTLELQSALQTSKLLSL
jgi:hypothetical protein